MQKGTTIMVTNIPTQLAITLERTNAGACEGLGQHPGSRAFPFLTDDGILHDDNHSHCRE